MASSNHIPLYVNIELTQRCNFKCAHCYNLDRAHFEAKKTGIPEQRMKELIRELAAAGSIQICFTGGEPLLDTNLMMYVREAKQNKFLVKIKSNGSLITEDKANELKEAGVDEAEISIYGATKESYAYFTKRGHLPIVTNALRFLKQNKILTKANIILHRHNVDELGQMIEMINRFEVPYQISTEITQRYDGSQTDDLYITEEQFASLLTSEYTSFFQHYNPNNTLKCECARTVCAINCDGEVYPCIGAPIPSGNIMTDTFKNIWGNSPTLNFIRQIKTSDIKECCDCNLKTFCDRSPGAAYINTGNYLSADPRSCMLARARAKAQAQFKSSASNYCNRP